MIHMNMNTYQYLKSRPDLHHFVRMNPIWYRYLMRNPNRIMEIEKESKQFYGKTMPQQLEKWNSRIEMVDMLLQFAEAMKD